MSLGYNLSRQLSPKKFQTLIISPRSHFVFTPLLNSTAVGTLEFRNALEPVRSRSKPNVEYMQGRADDVDFDRKVLTVEETVVSPGQGHPELGVPQQTDFNRDARLATYDKKQQRKRWEVPYDKLVVSVGCYAQTFGIKGVKEHAFFMKDVGDARRVRKRVLECFEIAALPTTSEKLRHQLLHFAVVGGGPTGMEFAAELSDLVSEDMTKLYPNLAHKVRVTIYDVAPRVLAMFDDKLGSYAMKHFQRQGVDLKTSHHIKELRQGLPRTGREEHPEEATDSNGCYTLTTDKDGEVGVGMCVWSTGNMMNPFVQKSLQQTRHFPSASAYIFEGAESGEPAAKEEWMIEKNPKSGAIVVDEHLRVQLHTKTIPADGNKEPIAPTSRAYLTDVFALGDNAKIRGVVLPATAQKANQQALWLGKHLNNDTVATQKFEFKNLGIMAYLGGAKALLQTGGGRGVEGYLAWLVWRGAYLTKSVSWRNRALIPTFW